MDVSYGKKKDEILITNPCTQAPPEQPPKSPEPIVYKEELILGDSVEFGDIKLTVNGLFSKPKEYMNNYLYYGIDYQVESLSDSTDGIYIESQIEVQSGRIYYLDFVNPDKIYKDSPIRNINEYYEGISIPKDDLPVKIKIKLISYVKTLDVLGYATWSL